MTEQTLHSSIVYISGYPKFRLKNQIFAIHWKSPTYFKRYIHIMFAVHGSTRYLEEARLTIEKLEQIQISFQNGIEVLLR